MPLKLHFLNVGHGDCTFIEFPSGRLMMVDINNSKSLSQDDVEALTETLGNRVLAKSVRDWEEYYKSFLEDPYEYYKANFAGRSVFRYVQTHPDMDHMSGLHRFFWEEEVGLVNFWDVDHAKELSEESFQYGPYAYVDWLVYQLLRSGNGPKDASGNFTEQKVIQATRDDSQSYWDEDGIKILSPTPELVSGCNESGDFNDCSYVLAIDYAGRRIILPGDAESPTWRSILDHYDPADLKCDILKAAHHGRYSGYHKEAVGTMDPSTVICSVGKKPSTDASAEYAKVADNVFSTRYHGTITVTVWHDGDIWVHDRNGKRIATMEG